MNQTSRSDLEILLQQGISELKLSLPSDVQKKLLDYIYLLQQWNKTYSLTAIHDLKQMVINHLLDSLAVAPYIIGPNILDFGSGAGLPGIPLALIMPQFQFVLLDSSKKKTNFLQHVALMLGIKNIIVVNQRIEQFSFVPQFATIITRATTDLHSIIIKTKNLCARDGQILVMKGKYPSEELAAVDEDVSVFNLQVPKLDAVRHLVKIKASKAPI